MKYAFATLALAVSGVKAGWGNGTVVTTEVVTKLTTYCPEATKITLGSKTYTVTEAATLTITDCPCTLTKHISTSTPTSTLSPTVETLSTKSKAPYTWTTTALGHASGTGVMPSSTSSVFTGAAGRQVAGGFVAAVGGLIALAL